MINKAKTLNIIIMGCSRLGARLASLLLEDGHKVTVVDNDSYSFRRLAPDFTGTALLGNSLQQDVMVKAGIEQSDIFIALTQGDNRNFMACEIAKQIYNVPRVICRIYDPLRQEIFKRLGIEAMSPTAIFADILKEKVDKGEAE